MYSIATGQKIKLSIVLSRYFGQKMYIERGRERASISYYRVLKMDRLICINLWIIHWPICIDLWLFYNPTGNVSISTAGLDAVSWVNFRSWEYSHIQLMTLFSYPSPTPTPAPPPHPSTHVNYPFSSIARFCNHPIKNKISSCQLCKRADSTLKHTHLTATINQAMIFLSNFGKEHMWIISIVWRNIRKGTVSWPLRRLFFRLCNWKGANMSRAQEEKKKHWWIYRTLNLEKEV